MSMRPCQNTGIDTPAKAMTVTMLSKNELGFVAEMTPTGMPMSAANVTAYSASSPVAGSRAAISSTTGRLERIDSPEIELHRPCHPPNVLDVGRVVETELFSQPLQLLGRRKFTQRQQRGIAGRQLHN